MKSYSKVVANTAFSNLVVIGRVHCQEGWTPCIMAAQNGHIEVMKILLESGADVNASSKVPMLAYLPHPMILGPC
jgi:ankyrin repeat protein